MNNDCRDQVQPHLQSGEQLIAVCEGELAPGVPERPVWLRQPPQESELERRIKSRLPGAVQRFLRPSEPKPAGGVERTMEGAEPAVDNTLAQVAHGKGMYGGRLGESSGAVPGESLQCRAFACYQVGGRVH